MEPSFWHQKWERGEIGFHEVEVNPLLTSHFDKLNPAAGGRVFLPLCGKTRDFEWLLARGYRVVGAELSELAINELFANFGLKPDIAKVGELIRYSAKDIDIWVGDIFAVSAELLGPVNAIYDRAALIALPAGNRENYAIHLMNITDAAPQLLIAIEYDQRLMQGPPFSVSADEIQRHYGAAYQLQSAESRTIVGGLKGKVPALEKRVVVAEMLKSPWSVDTIPDQRGRIAVVTGASSGIGLEAARVLAQKNATVILAVRNAAKGQEVADSIRGQFANAVVVVRELDLASLNSIRAFAEGMFRDYRRLDILINNAGVMMCPYEKTRDGFEIQFGTNHLGHFALTLQLLPLLTKTNGSRVVVVSSLGHRRGKLDFSDLNWTKRKYSTVQAYCDTKLANLYFTYELARLLEARGNNPRVTAAHPGWTATELQRHLGVFKYLNPLFGQSIPMGALPTLRAAFDVDALPGDYFGPDKFLEQRGNAIKVKSNARSHDMEAARELWKLSEELTGLKYG